jgi:peptidoglycan/xylan/chitin deacetylase (PgdA/CDA1 family)
VTHVKVEDRLAALTFDDGPDPVHTPQLLQILARHGARATFFVIGERAAQSPEIVDQIVKGGHELGNHTWDHPSLPRIGPAARVRQLEQCASAILPHRTSIMRPPYSEQSLGSYLTAKRMGYEVVAWNVQVEDWRPHPARVMEDWLVQRIRPGSITVLHDSLWRPRYPEASPRGPLFEALEAALEKLPRFRFVTVSELLKAGRPTRVPWFADDRGVRLAAAWPARGRRLPS